MNEPFFFPGWRPTDTTDTDQYHRTCFADEGVTVYEPPLSAGRLPGTRLTFKLLRNIRPPGSGWLYVDDAAMQRRAEQLAAAIGPQAYVNRRRGMWCVDVTLQ